MTVGILPINELNSVRATDNVVWTSASSQKLDTNFVYGTYTLLLIQSWQYNAIWGILAAKKLSGTVAESKEKRTIISHKENCFLKNSNEILF